MFGFFQKKASDTTFKQIAAIVEGFMKKVGVNPENQRLKGEMQGWGLVRGSAIIYIFVNEDKNGSTIRIVSPIVYLPQDNLVAFYRKCLELNSDLHECALAVHKDVVTVVYERRTLDLSKEELEHNVQWLAYVADELDHRLAKEFGCKVFSETPK
jgi:hypothetical protein